MEKIFPLKRKYSDILFILVVTLTVFPFLILSFFNHPASDDYCYSNLVNNHGFWTAQFYHYFSWTGRYTATFLLTLDPIDYNHLMGYKILPVALFVLFFLSIFLFLKNIFPRTSRRDQILLSFLIFFLYIYYIPSMAEAFFWRAGSVTYQLASILSLLFFTTIVQMLRQKSAGKRFAYTLLSCFLSVIIIGLNETHMVILIVIISLWLAALFIGKKEKKMEVGIIFIVTIIAAVIVILAPGNAVRMAEKPEKFQFIFSVVEALKISLLFILSWLPMPVLMIALFSPLLGRFSREIFNRYKLEGLKLWHLGLLSILLFGFIALCFFPSFWSQGGRPPYRTINVIYLLFIFGALSLTLLFFVFLQIRNTPAPQLPKKIQLFVSLVIFSIIIAKPNNIREAYLDILEGTAYRYNQEMNERYTLLESCSQESLTIPAIKNKPETIFSSDVWPDPFHENYYYNQCLSGYLNFQSIYTLPAEE